MSISIANGFASTYSELLESSPSVREAIIRQIVQKRDDFEGCLKAVEGCLKDVAGCLKGV